MEFEGKVALVTGGASGIGAASAIALAKAGADVVITGLHAGDLGEVAKTIEGFGRKAMTAVCDVGDEVAMAALFADVTKSVGRLDVVLVNAGINGMWTPIEEMTPDEWDRTVRVNLRGSYLTIHHAVPLMKAKGGSIVLISSINGTRTFTTAGATAYSATKAAQLAMGKMLAVELAGYQIRVNVICPGAIKTRLAENTWKRNEDSVRFPAIFPEGTIPLTKGESGSAEDIAETVVYLSSNAARHITGTPVFIDGGQSLVI